VTEVRAAGTGDGYRFVASGDFAEGGWWLVSLVGRGVSAGKSDRSDFGEIYSEKSLGSRSIRDRTGLAVLSLCICVVTPNTMGTVDVLFPDRGA
ncbi:hypothetical protein, partial [Mycobacterium helveticum]|uniref:hypothetical protein n=1 Tax=Mycobacterium helveticum TaxID=2592811 RepID=UPI001AEFFA95